MPSAQEIENAKYTMKSIIETYVNNLLTAQAINKQMRDLHDWAKEHNQQDNPDIKRTISELQTIGTRFVDDAKVLLENIKQASKKDPDIWTIVEQVTEKAKSGANVGGTYGISGRTQILVKKSDEVSAEIGSAIPQVGVAPVLVIIAIAVTVLAISGSLVAYYTTDEARTLAVVKKQLYTQRMNALKNIDIELKRKREALEKLQQGKIKEDEYKQIVNDADKNIQDAKIEAGLSTQQVPQGEHTDPLGLGRVFGMFKPYTNAFVGALIVGGALYVAWKMGWIQKMFGKANDMFSSKKAVVQDEVSDVSEDLYEYD